MKKILISMLALFAIATTASAQGNSINGHEYVDLGLPSGLLWATCNVGATKPEEKGDYFAWGETKPKKDYSWATYKWCKGSDKTMTKYCNNREYGNNGFTDNLTTLEAEDDAAAVNWKSGWRMPTYAEFRELRDNTTNEEVTVNGMKGFKFISKTNDNSIFLPVAGWGDGTFISAENSKGCYWASSLSFTSNDAFFLGLTSAAPSIPSEVYVTAQYRYRGHSVRPVYQKPKIAIDATNFPDAKFRNFLLAQDYGKDAILTNAEIAAVTEINVLNKGISNLTGIHYFTNLQTLNCTENNLTSLDVSANTELTTLYCSVNQLSALDVSNNKKLTTLYCYYNQIGKDAMQTLVNGLPTVSDRQFRAINMDGINNGKEKNFITPAQVEAAKNKGWNVWGKCDVDGTFKWQEFAGAVTITATANNADYGTVTGAGIYEKDRNVTLKATPKTGYKFVKWTKHRTGVGFTDITNANATYTFTATSAGNYRAVFEKDDTKTLVVTFTKATTLASELSNEDKLVLAAVVVLAQKGKLDGYSVGIDPRDKGVVTLKKGTKSLFVSDNNKGITVPSGVTSADNINVTLTDGLRKALTTDLATQLASYDAIQVKFDISTPTAIDASLNDNGKMINDSWYTIDGVKLSGEPTKKGIYICKGKKVKK